MKKKREKHRIGRLRVSGHLLRNGWESLLSSLSPHIVVVRAEMQFATDEMEYMALSPHFDEIEVGELPPQYTAQLRTLEDGSAELVKFERWRAGKVKLPPVRKVSRK